MHLRWTQALAAAWMTVAALAGDAQQAPPGGGVKWQSEFGAAVESARQSGRPLFVAFR